MASSLVTAISISALASAAAAQNVTQQCRCFPGDACWPSTAVWNHFNDSVDGQLIKTVPQAAPCHTPNYDAAVCEELTDEWLWPWGHYDDASSIMAPWFTNYTCDPFHAISQPCRPGNFIRYAVNVSEPHHVFKALAFVQKHNIRLVVRNTGHDYNGKSTGAGALGIWMHHLKEIEIVDYERPWYTGKAMKMGAGVQGIEAYRAADAQGLEVVGGECPTVGLAGGYSQGGGHSALSSRYGLGADQVLEWEVITAGGEFVVARRDNEYADLYWALCGGGGGTYGVVWSMTSKAHTGHPASGLNLTFSNEGVSQDTFFEAVGLYHATLPAIVDAGAMSEWHFTNTSFGIAPLTGPNIPVNKLRELIQPFTDGLTSLGIRYTLHAQQFDSYLAEFGTMQAPIQVGIAQYGGYLIPRAAVLQNNTALTNTYRSIVSSGAVFTGVATNVSRALVGADIDEVNAVNPAWRDMLIDTVLMTEWNFTAPRSAMVRNQRRMTDLWIPQLIRMAPGSGAYLNEADFLQPDWQRVFYGWKYPRLLEIKKKYDPQDVFYGWTAVGSEGWRQRWDGRLCRV